MTPPDAYQTAVLARGLTRRFGELTALDELDLTVAYGEIFGLVGPDGAGKTTALRILAGILAPDAGQVEVAGVDVAADPVRVRDHLAYMSQRFGLYADLTVDENIDFYADLFHGPGDAEGLDNGADTAGDAAWLGDDAVAAGSKVIRTAAG